MRGRAEILFCHNGLGAICTVNSVPRGSDSAVRGAHEHEHHARCCDEPMSKHERALLLIIRYRSNNPIPDRSSVTRLWISPEQDQYYIHQQ